MEAQDVGQPHPDTGTSIRTSSTSRLRYAQLLLFIQAAYVNLSEGNPLSEISGETAAVRAFTQLLVRIGYSGFRLRGGGLRYEAANGSVGCGGLCWRARGVEQEVGA